MGNNASAFQKIKMLATSINQLQSKVTVSRDASVTTNVASIWSIPEEVLQMLLLKYTSSKDIQHFCFAFPQITMMDINKQIWLFDQIFPVILRYLKNKDILNLRLVSKRWRRYVDSYLEEKHTELQVFLHKIKLYDINCNKLLRISSSEVFNDDKKYFLVRRSVRVYFGLSPNDDQNLKYFLAKYGNQISHLQLSVKCATTKTYIDYLCHLFHKCQHLKSIKFKGILKYRGELVKPLAFPTDLETFSEYNRLKNNWPKSLNYICFENWGQFEDSMLQEICSAVMSNDQKTTRILKPCMMLKGDCGNIVKIDLEITSCSQLVSLMNLGFPLKELLLLLRFTHTDSNGELVFHLLYKIIHQFKSTLASLQIQIEGSSLRFRHGGLRQYSLDLPCLKKICLKNFPVHEYYVLGKLQSLESLAVLHNAYGNDSCGNEKAKDVSFVDIPNLFRKEPVYPFHEPYHSNIWTIFSKLKTFIFGNDIHGWENKTFRRYRRDTYEKHRLLCKFDACRNYQKDNKNWNKTNKKQK